MNSNILRNTKFNLTFFLSASVVPLLVTGPFLPSLLMSCLSIWFVYFTVRNRLHGIYKNKFFLFLIAFNLVIIISSLNSEDIFMSLKNSFFYFRIGIFALMINYLISQDRNILEYFYVSFLITFTAILVDGLIQYFTGSNIFGSVYTNARLSSFFGDELILGSYLSRLTPLFLALYFSKIRVSLFENLYVLILMMGIYLLVFLSGERASFFFINMSFIFLFIFLKKIKFYKKILFLSFCIILVVFFGYSDQKYKNRFVDQTIESMGLAKSNNLIIFTESHQSFYKIGYKMFLEKPLFGHGPKMFRVQAKKDEFKLENNNAYNIHPHNFYIQLLAETGIFGFLFLFSLFVYFIYLILKHIKYYIFNKKIYFSDFQICLLAGFLITLWPITTNGNFFTNHLLMFYSLQIGFFHKINVKLIQNSGKL